MSGVVVEFFMSFIAMEVTKQVWRQAQNVRPPSEQRLAFLLSELRTGSFSRLV